MSSGSTKPPKAPDPQMLIDAQTRANRVNQVGPYGSSIYSTDENGQATQTSTLSPQMQAILERVFAQAGQRPEQAQQYQPPAGLDQLTNAIGSRVASNYGMTKPSQQPMQQPNLAQSGGGMQQALQSAMQNSQQTMPQAGGGGMMEALMRQQAAQRGG